MKSVAETLNKLALGLASLLMIAIFIVAALGVLFRYLLQHSLSWADETGAYLFIWMIFLGAAAEVWEEGHPAVHILVDRIPPALRYYVRILANLSIAAWGAVLLVNGIKAVIIEAPESWSSLPGISLQIPYAIIPIAGALIIVFAIAKVAVRR